jgi:hypothetical protein
MKLIKKVAIIGLATLALGSSVAFGDNAVPDCSKTAGGTNPTGVKQVVTPTAPAAAPAANAGSTTVQQPASQPQQ